MAKLEIGNYTIVTDIPRKDPLLQRTSDNLNYIYLNETEKVIHILNELQPSIGTIISLAFNACQGNYSEILDFLLNKYNLSNSYDLLICAASVRNNIKCINLIRNKGGNLNSALNYAKNAAMGNAIENLLEIIKLICN